MKTTHIHILLTFLLFSTINSLYAQVYWKGKTHNPDDLIQYVLKTYKEGNTAESISVSRRVLQIYPDYVDFKYILGLNYQKLNLLDSAIMKYQDVLENESDYIDAYISLTQCYLLQGEINDAKKISGLALNKFSANSDVIALHSKVLDEEARIFQDRHISSLWNQVQQAVVQDNAKDLISISDSLKKYLPADDLWYLDIKSKGYKLLKDYDNLEKTLLEIKHSGDTSNALIYQLAEVSAAQKDYRQAALYMEKLISKNPYHYAYQKTAKIYRENIPYDNFIGLSHTHMAVDKPSGWNFITGIEYGRRVNELGTISGVFNYGFRRGEIGYQAGLDAWLNYSKKFYGYHHIAYASGIVFPTWRAAYSLYHENNGWIFDLGGRYIRSADQIDNYSIVGSAGKYIGNTMVYFRTFLLNDQQRWNYAYSLSLRHYYNDNKPDSYVTLIGNLGTSPDDPARYQYLYTTSGFLSRSLNAGWQHRLESWGIGLMGGWNYFKISDNEYLNQFDLNLSLKKYF